MGGGIRISTTLKKYNGRGGSRIKSSVQTGD